MEQEDKKTNGAQEKDTPDSATGANLQDETKRVVRGEADDASRILGPHWVEDEGKRRLVVRAFRPGAMAASIFWRGNIEPQTMAEIDAGGLFEAVVASRAVPSRDKPIVVSEFRSVEREQTCFGVPFHCFGRR